MFFMSNIKTTSI